MRPRNRKPTPRADIDLSAMTEHERQLFEALKSLRNAEWMVTADWSDKRGEVLDAVDKALQQTAAAFGIVPDKEQYWRPDQTTDVRNDR